MKYLILFRSWIPEIYLIISVLYYWALTTLLNPVAISLMLVLVALIYFKNKALGLTVAVIFLALNAYMVLAMLSELSEFTEFNSNYFKLIVFGTAYLGLNIFFGIKMLTKWRNTDMSLEM